MDETSAGEPAFETVGLDHVAIRVTDLDRALDFYAGLLGMDVRDRELFEAGELPFVACVAGSQHLHVVPIDGDEEDDDRENSDAAGDVNEAANIDVGGEHVCLLFRSNDTDTREAIDAMLDWLRESGVEVEAGEPKERLGAYGRDWAAYVRDPDGRRVELKFH
jgi:catechol 2,3-dioxygenase-like lactoylglutathione lyase family enzyme